MERVFGVTIDDTRTRDIDDAIWVEESANGWEVYVSIADVAHGVTLGSDIDLHALDVVTTKYFATGNSPMLPRDLGENKLSLWPGHEKRVLTVQVCLGTDFHSKGSSIYKARLKSAAKLNYAQMPQILNGECANIVLPEILVGDGNATVTKMLRNAATIAMGLLARRRAEGALALYDLNNGWVTTEEGHLRRLEPHDANVGYIIIQELMILANAEVAKFALHHDIPVLFRNHVARAAAPDRAELLRQLSEALITPVMDIDIVRQRTHMLLDKADYGATLKGHYGLNLPAYLHFTSPIRRYPDLVVHRQIRAFLKNEPLPYSAQDIENLGNLINVTLKAEAEALSDAMKSKAEGRARRAIDHRRLDGLGPKDYERVVKVEARSGEDASPALLESFQKRLFDERIPVICLAVVFGEAAALPGWEQIRKMALEYLARRPEMAVSVVAIVVQTASWGEPEYETHRSGADHEPTFRVTAKIKTPHAEGAGVAEGGNAKLAKQLATVRMLADAVGISPPTFEPKVEARKPPKPPPKASKYVWVEGKDPTSALLEYAQSISTPGPTYAFERSGPDHTPTITCSCSFLNFQSEAVAGSKQQAKRLASQALIEKIRA